MGWLGKNCDIGCRAIVDYWLMAKRVSPTILLGTYDRKYYGFLRGLDLDQEQYDLELVSASMRPLAMAPTMGNIWLWHKEWIRIAKQSLKLPAHRFYPVRLLKKNELYSEDYFAFQNLNRINAIDAAKSLAEYHLLPGPSDRFERVKGQLFLDEEVTKGTPIFVDPRFREDVHFVSDEFIDLLKKSFPKKLLSNLWFENSSDFSATRTYKSYV